MKKTIKIFLSCLLPAAVMKHLGACKKNYTNPSAATEEEVFSSAKGLTGVSVGLQRTYTSGLTGSLTGSIYNLVTANGFVTRELDLRNEGNVPEFQLFKGGGSVDGTNTVLFRLWESSNKIMYDADKVIESAKNLSDKPYASGLIGYSTIFKALAIGNLSMCWESVPASVGENVGFVMRKEGFGKAIAAIDEALAAINAVPPNAAFLANIPAGIDIVNTLHALKARYAIYTENYAMALTEAGSVDLSKASVFNFNTVNLNPIFEIATSTNNVYQPLDSTLGLPVALHPDPSDKRIPFYLAIASAPRFRIKGFAVTSTTPIPLYLPGEMLLIRAEAFTRQNDLTAGLAELNRVVTKAPAGDIFGVGADLPAIPGGLSKDDLLSQIYRHRCIELFMSGLKLEDMRRFNRPNAERKRNFFPYPFRERDSNTNTPDDPEF